MGLFTKTAPATEPTLHERHALADQQGERALGVFRAAANDLALAADQHVAVANEAQAVIDAHTTLRDAANQAASDKVRQAQAISKLIG